ncbi:MAG: hypothetical protein ACYTG0_21730 [Planctomycetota bacterium]|jgi:hypothetical protein
MADDDVARYPWYHAVSGSDLHQGDILLECPVFLIPRDAVGNPGDHEITIERERQNVIVMTQSCDLAIRKDGKCCIEDVILAALYFRHELTGDKRFRRNESWEDARKGRFPGYHLLNKCEIPGHKLDYMLVDLRKVFTLSVDAAREVAAEGSKQRVRLQPPYREHLAQAFARFFMRVGLPVEIPPFK